MSTILPLFWNLSSASTHERLDASVKLLGALEQFQAQHVPAELPSPDEDEESGEDSKLDVMNAQDVAYAIRRLVRGLASPRESSRLGFAVALTELLSRIDSVTCRQVLNLIMDSSRGQGSISGQEERDMLFARLFGFTAVVQSGLLFRTNPLPSSMSSDAAPADLESYEEYLAELLAVGEKKSWLRESAWWTLILVVDALEQSEVDWKDAAKDVTLSKVFAADVVWSPEKIAMTLKMQAKYPAENWRDFLAPTFKHGNPLHVGNLVPLARILKESSDADDEGEGGVKASTGSWKPQLHFVWEIILEQLIADETKKNASLQDFFRIVVDESLFAINSSAERKSWGFQVFQKALPRASAENVPMLFTKNFMRTWINHLSAQDRYLHKAARQVATDIQAVVQKNPTLGFTLVVQLTGVNGSRQFDKLTKTKTVESIFTAMDANGIKAYIDYLFAHVNLAGDEEIGEHALHARRLWVVDQLAALIRNGAVPKDDEWVGSVVDWLVIHGLFEVKKKSKDSPYQAIRMPAKPVFDDELRKTCRHRLLSCLADLTTHTSTVQSEGGKTSKIIAATVDGEFWLVKALSTVHKLENESKHASLLLEADEEETSLRAKTRESMTNLKTATADHGSAARGAELLLAACLLQRYCADEEDETDDSLEDAVDAVGKMFAPPPKKKSKKARKSEPTEPSDGDAPEPLDMLIDIIIGFLEESTAFLRAVANQVFTLLAVVVERPESLDLILTQLARRDPTQEDETMSVDGEDEEAGDDDGVEANGVSADDGSDDASPAEEDDEDIEADLELRRKVEEALSAGGTKPGADSDDESEELMDDDQMMAIDEQLAQIFKSQTKKPKDSDAQRRATHFKNRVLDFVDIFLKTRATSGLAVRCMLPLLDLITGTSSDEKQLSDKANGIIRSRYGKQRETPIGVDVASTTETLLEIHVRARKARSQDHLSTISLCSLYLAKTLLAGARDSVVDAYKTSLTDFATRKASALNGNFFQDLARRQPAEAWQLRTDLLDVAARAVNGYRQCQTFQVLQVVLNQSSFVDGIKDECVAFMPTLRDALLGVLTKACEDKSLSAAQMKDLLKLASSSARQTKRLCTPEQLSITWTPSAWNQLRVQLAASDRFKSSTALLNACKQLAQLTGAPAAAPHTNGAKTAAAPPTETTESADPQPKKASKRKAEQTKGAHAEGSPEKAKRKKSKKA